MKLKTELNASQLIEDLLRHHYDLEILKHEKPDLDEINKKADELHLKLEELEKTKEKAEEYEDNHAQLSRLGITNQFLIQRLKAAKDKNIFIMRTLKDEYQIPEILALFKAWDILHAKEQ